MYFISKYIRSFLSPIWNGEKCKMVIVVRSDLPMGKGKTAAQCAHAALECCRQTFNNEKKRLMFQSWLQVGQPKIIVKIPNEQELLTLADKAQRAGLITAIIRDAGKTQLRPGTVTVVGIGPGSNEVIDSLTSKLRLL
ncbi:peptidyl-tRNA hydrolase 2, mitochondrial-like isoform X1 [Pogonomyrmex barbatus]|uniref:peptidyl-tRNA hydrolase n=1 Tax=Pogonomyrmex barbatus TaxID=144034 RepID=A0A6I9W3Y7_9HYME|nr:peptidyl-tRNA hydrolase 2, mitochondrial-like isoform X1 [Pogonomyrmex barbatus]XP_011633173.1 peptidyl-tRNA hydrolase 2, mitochondrial-like isoform X1 [Pogonomyrmex barbatus]